MCRVVEGTYCGQNIGWKCELSRINVLTCYSKINVASKIAVNVCIIFLKKFLRMGGTKHCIFERPPRQVTEF